MKTVHFGIIGCGLVGREFASAAIRWGHLVDANSRPKIVAVCDKNPDRLELLEYDGGETVAVG